MRGKDSYKADYFNHMKNPDVFTPAAFALRDGVNSYLENALSLEIDFEPQTFEFNSMLRYGSLGAALIAEAAVFLVGHFEAQQCKICGSWFRIGRDQKRRDKVFCSVACKMRDYRSRKAGLNAQQR